MNTEHLLRATRPVHLLVHRPGQSASVEPKYWSMQLEGLHQSCIKTSAKALRNDRKRPNQLISDEASLKVSGLHHGLAKVLGAKSFDYWRDSEHRLVGFLRTHGMTQPADLIHWSRSPSRLTARKVSDRLFNSALPMPKKIFTGVGSGFFIATGRGRVDIDWLSRNSDKRSVYGDRARYEWCEAHANQIVLSLKKESDWDGDAPESVDLTGRDLLLHAFRDRIATALNLLGDNLVDPMKRAPEFRLYNASEDELAFCRRVFDIFREEIGCSNAGWVEVIPLPDNDNIVFLKGVEGAFDWVVRDQRDEVFTGNPYHPILKSNELPTAMKASEVSAHLYFKPGEWYERLEHDAETRHYVEGGTTATWPGYSKLLMRELIASRRNYVQPGFPRGRRAENFVPHQLNGYCLMISPLITVKEFWRFFENSDWRDDRITRTEKTSDPLEADLAAVNRYDEDHLPASVTWFDAVAFCKCYEAQTGLPVRLLEVEEWKQICPSPAQDIEKDGWGDLTWGVVAGDGVTGVESELRYRENWSIGGLHFRENLSWLPNKQGLPFLSIVDFGEWLADCHDGHAPAANAATGKALMTGPLDRDRCPAHLTMRYKGLKVGFRLCYVAHPDA